jgi:hypothetical protein
MKSALMVTAAGLFACSVLHAADRGFDDIVRAISDEFQIRPVHIPFFGLVNFTVAVAHPAGVKHLHLAIFEDVDLNGRDLGKVMNSAAPGWLPFVRSRDRHETALIYAKEERRDFQLLVASLESGELTLVELKLDPDAIRALLREPDKSVDR